MAKLRHKYPSNIRSSCFEKLRPKRDFGRNETETESDFFFKNTYPVRKKNSLRLSRLT